MLAGGFWRDGIQRNHLHGLVLAAGSIDLFPAGTHPDLINMGGQSFHIAIPEQEAIPGRPSYMGQSTWNWDLNITTLWDLSERWQLFALLNREGLGKQIKASPLVERSSAYSLLFSISYRIK